MKNLVFLVEDDSAISDIYKTLIEKSGFRVEVFSMGNDVIKNIKGIKEKTDEKKPSIVLLDLILPDVSGLEVLKEIRGNEATRDVKVFILTNQDGVEFEESSSVKPDKIIIKANITPTQLVETIKKELK